MAVEILRKKDDGTMEKLDIGGEAELEPTGAANNPVYIDEDGKPAECCPSNTTRIGGNASAGGDHAAAFGYRSNASGSYSIASGYYSRSSGKYSISLGAGTSTDYATASEENAVAMGYKAKAQGKNSLALGANAVAENDNDICFGTETRGAKNKGIYLDGGLVTETDEFMTADTIAKMTTDDVDALFA